MLSISSVSKSYGRLIALDDISLSIDKGEFLGLLGPNGAGKSTLMSLVAGLKTPDAGHISINGLTAICGDSHNRQDLGLVPQNIALYDDLSAEENLHVFGELFGLDRSTRRERIDEGLAAVGLAERRRDRVKGFSGGMKRRLNLIAALADGAGPPLGGVRSRGGGWRIVPHRGCLEGGASTGAEHPRDRASRLGGPGREGMDLDMLVACGEPF
jgi:ABC-type multidrug transport system ATPase subunit